MFTDILFVKKEGNGLKIIDYESWERKEHFAHFNRMEYPFFNICVNIDITNFLSRIKEKKLAFYFAMIYAATNTLNQVEAFRYRKRGDQIILHETIHPAFTHLGNDTQLYKNIMVDMENTIEEFVVKAREKSENQTAFLKKEDQIRDDVLYITCAPWVSFTQLTHPISFNKDDTIPRLSWGKYYKENDKIVMPFSLQANHVFVDGYHVGKYFECLQQFLDAFY